MPTPTPRTHSRTATWLAALAAGVLLQVASAVTWYRAGAKSFTGAELTGRLVGSLGWLVIVLLVLLLVVRATGRRVVGAVMALVGVGAVAVSLLKDTPGPDELTALGNPAGSATGAAWLGVAGGALAVLAGVLLVLFAAHWPTRRVAQTSVAAGEVDLWRAQDKGLDPTVDEAAEPTR